MFIILQQNIKFCLFEGGLTYHTCKHEFPGLSQDFKEYLLYNGEQRYVLSARVFSENPTGQFQSALEYVFRHPFS